MSKKRQRRPRQRSAYLGRSPAPAEVSWTPLRQECGCVTDWGWDSQTVPPPAFISWCLEMVGVNCPWHGGAAGRPILSPAGEVVRMQDPGSGFSFYARRASDEDVDLGGRLAGQLRELVAKIVKEDRQALLAEIPIRQRDWLRANGYDPLDAWLDQRLTDIVLNRGRVVLTPELLDRLAPPDQQSNTARHVDGRIDDQVACQRCAFSAATGGILCLCGHDWGCHPDDVAGGEPCSHCSCQDMETAEDAGQPAAP